MVTDKQVGRLFRLLQIETTLSKAALTAGMDAKTARKYRRLGRLPSEAQLLCRLRRRERVYE